MDFDTQKLATLEEDLKRDLDAIQRVRKLISFKNGALSSVPTDDQWQRIRTMEAPPHVAMLTASEDGEDVMQAMRLGALGYVLKGVGGAELTALVRDLAAGRPHIAPSLAGRLLLSMRGGAGGKAPATPPDPLADLSRREEDILRLVAQGKSNREVGDELDLQEKTVKHYMTSILQKLQVRNRVEAAMLMREHRKV